MGALVLVGGGVRSGKSAFALEVALRHAGPRAFLATAEARDDEMRARIARHRAERGDAFETVEAPRRLPEALGAVGGGVAVVDCLTLWLSNLLLDELDHDAIGCRVEALAQVAAERDAETIVVTNEVGMGVVPPTPLGRAFRDVAGRAHQRLAADASAIYFAALGTIVQLRPSALEVRR